MATSTPDWETSLSSKGAIQQVGRVKPRRNIIDTWPPPKPQDRSINLPKGVCHDFLQKGNCHRKVCRFSHVRANKKDTARNNEYKKGTCYPFQKGNCPWGETCRFSHDIGSSNGGRNNGVTMDSSRNSHEFVGNNIDGKVENIARTKGFCYDFGHKGFCQRGDTCPYVHQALTKKKNDEDGNSIKGVCFGFQKGICLWGKTCRYSHDLSADNTSIKVGDDIHTDGDIKNDIQKTISHNHDNVEENDHETGICYDFQSGKCQMGNSCTYSHAVSTLESENNVQDREHDIGGNVVNDSEKNVPCIDFQKGICEWGELCHFLHETSTIMSDNKNAEGNKHNLSNNIGHDDQKTGDAIRDSLGYSPFSHQAFGDDNDNNKFDDGINNNKNNIEKNEQKEGVCYDFSRGADDISTHESDNHSFDEKNNIDDNIGLDSSKTGFCYDFSITGKCNRGNSCKFSHDVSTHGSDHDEKNSTVVNDNSQMDNHQQKDSSSIKKMDNSNENSFNVLIEYIPANADVTSAQDHLVISGIEYISIEKLPEGGLLFRLKNQESYQQALIELRDWANEHRASEPEICGNKKRNLDSLTRPKWFAPLFPHIVRKKWVIYLEQLPPIMDTFFHMINTLDSHDIEVIIPRMINNGFELGFKSLSDFKEAKLVLAKLVLETFVDVEIKPKPSIKCESAEKKRTCFQWLDKGTCRYGDTCKFSHTIDPESADTVEEELYDDRGDGYKLLIFDLHWTQGCLMLRLLRILKDDGIQPQHAFTWKSGKCVLRFVNETEGKKAKSCLLKADYELIIEADKKKNQPVDNEKTLVIDFLDDFVNLSRVYHWEDLLFHFKNRNLNVLLEQSKRIRAGFQLVFPEKTDLVTAHKILRSEVYVDMPHVELNAPQSMRETNIAIKYVERKIKAFEEFDDPLKTITFKHEIFRCLDWLAEQLYLRGGLLQSAKRRRAIIPLSLHCRLPHMKQLKVNCTLFSSLLTLAKNMLHFSLYGSGRVIDYWQNILSEVNLNPSKIKKSSATLKKRARQEGTGGNATPEQRRQIMEAVMAIERKHKMQKMNKLPHPFKPPASLPLPKSTSLPHYNLTDPNRHPLLPPNKPYILTNNPVYPVADPTSYLHNPKSIMRNSLHPPRHIPQPSRTEHHVTRSGIHMRPRTSRTEHHALLRTEYRAPYIEHHVQGRSPREYGQLREPSQRSPNQRGSQNRKSNKRDRKGQKPKSKKAYDTWP